jgi:HD-GYP domain-containing protein (c-di-GMP phosphodiesterase class II)
MTTGNFPVTEIWKRAIPGTGLFSRDRMNNIFNLSRQLVATNRLDVLLDSISRHATEILQVKFSRIITLEGDGSLMSQALHFNHALPRRAAERLRELTPDHAAYRQALLARGPILVGRDDDTITDQERKELGLEVVNSLCLIPLRVDSEPLGVLILGDGWKSNPGPFEEERLRLATLIGDQAASAVYRVRLSTRLKESQLETVLALAKTIEARDNYTGGHSDRMTEFAVQTAARLNCPYDEIQAIRWASLLHDIGKISIPDEILHKPGPLNVDEWEMVKSHPLKGAEIVLMASNLEHVAVLVLAHHEKYDGSGYPYKLEQQRIPIGARILAVVDAYSAMTDGRVYRKPITHVEAIEELRRCSGSHFDPVVVDAFISLFA